MRYQCFYTYKLYGIEYICYCRFMWCVVEENGRKHEDLKLKQRSKLKIKISRHLFTILAVIRAYELGLNRFKRPRKENSIIYNFEKKYLLQILKVRRFCPKCGALSVTSDPFTVLIITRSYELGLSRFKRPCEENWVIYNHEKNKVLEVSKVRHTSQNVRRTSAKLMQKFHRLKCAAHK